MPNHELNTIEQRLTPIDTHLKCRRCDYDLISLFPGDPCPECGTEIIVHAPTEGIRRFENDPTNKLPFLLTCGGVSMIVWFIYALAKGIPALEVLIIFCTIPIITILIIFFLNGERRLAVTLDWKNRRVIFERCFRSNAYWLSLRRKKILECSMDKILAVEIQHGRAWDNMRIFTPTGVANIPDSLRQWDELGRDLRNIASETPDVAFYRTTGWLIILMVLSLVSISVAVWLWATVFDPV